MVWWYYYIKKKLILLITKNFLGITEAKRIVALAAAYDIPVGKILDIK